MLFAASLRWAPAVLLFLSAPPLHRKLKQGALGLALGFGN